MLFLCAVALLSARAAAQTTPAVPPVKMGLWQSEVTIQMSGIPNAPAGAMPPRTISQEACMTSDSWKKAMQGLQGQQQAVDCSVSNMQQDAHHFTFDEQCSAQQGLTTNVHVDMQLDSDEGMHGSAAVTMNGPGVPQGMTMNSTITSKYLSDDCGDLKPGEQKTLPQ